MESNTGSDLGQGGVKRGAKTPIKAHGQGEVRYMVPTETPRERMLRVVQDFQKKYKKGSR